MYWFGKPYQKVQAWYKEDNNLWRISSAFGLDKSIHLYSLDCDIELTNIYKRVSSLVTFKKLFIHFELTCRKVCNYED